MGAYSTAHVMYVRQSTLYRVAPTILVHWLHDCYVELRECSDLLGTFLLFPGVPLGGGGISSNIFTHIQLLNGAYRRFTLTDADADAASLDKNRFL